MSTAPCIAIARYSMRSAAALPLHRGRPASAVLRDSRCLACRDFRIAREAGEPRAHNLFGWFAAWCVGGILWSAPEPVGRPFPPKHPAEPRARAKRAESGLVGCGLLLEVEAPGYVLKPWLACSATNAGITHFGEEQRLLPPVAGCTESLRPALGAGEQFFDAGGGLLCERVVIIHADVVERIPEANRLDLFPPVCGVGDRAMIDAAHVGDYPPPFFLVGCHTLELGANREQVEPSQFRQPGVVQDELTVLGHPGGTLGRVLKLDGSSEFAAAHPELWLEQNFHTQAVSPVGRFAHLLIALCSSSVGESFTPAGAGKPIRHDSDGVHAHFEKVIQLGGSLRRGISTCVPQPTLERETNAAKEKVAVQQALPWRISGCPRTDGGGPLLPIVLELGRLSAQQASQASQVYVRKSCAVKLAHSGEAESFKNRAHPGATKRVADKRGEVAIGGMIHELRQRVVSPFAFNLPGPLFQSAAAAFAREPARHPLAHACRSGWPPVGVEQSGRISSRIHLRHGAPKDGAKGLAFDQIGTGIAGGASFGLQAGVKNDAKAHMVERCIQAARQIGEHSLARRRKLADELRRKALRVVQDLVVRERRALQTGFCQPQLQAR